MTNPVRQLLLDYGAGKLGEADAITALERALVPLHAYPPAGSIHESYQREQADYQPPWTPGSWDEIDLAASDGTLTPAQALTLRAKVRAPPPVIDQYHPAEPA
jgi:hypothetical protein